MLEHTLSIIPVSICLRDSYCDTNFFSDCKELCFQFCQKKVQALFYMEQFSKGSQRRHLFGNMKKKKVKKQRGRMMQNLQQKQKQGREREREEIEENGEEYI